MFHFIHRKERKGRKGIWVVFFALFAVSATFAFPSSPALAQNGEPTDDEVNAVAKQLYCPVCENTPLDVCPTQACIQWRATIKEKLAAGWDEQQIKDYFVQQYGERVLAEPSARGLNLLVWVLPPIGVLIAAGLYVYYLRRMHRPAPAAPAPETHTDEYVRRLEEELAKRR